MTPVRILHEGEIVDADQLAFADAPAISQTVDAEDGSKIEFRCQLASVFKLRDRKRADGSPIYVVMGKFETNVTTAPERVEEQFR